MTLMDANRAIGCNANRVSAVRLIVELSAGDPVMGWVEPVGGRRERFEGLLEMLAAFDRLRGTERPGGGTDAADPPDGEPR